MYSVFYLLLLIHLSRSDVSPNYYCADMNPQQHINVEQLMGMWYGIEILTHNSEEHYVRIEPSCPILHISEDKEYRYSTISPLYKNVDYRHNYGEKRLPNQYPDRYPDYERTTQHPHQHQKQQHNWRHGVKHRDPNSYRRDDLMRGLRIWWDENGRITEYHLKYNLTMPGFWFSSGPQNGSELEPLYSNFAGTIQVIKAVGNHMVMTFCHRVPDRQLFSILLSRENKLDRVDIHSVHTLLARRGLSTTAVKKVCWNAAPSTHLSHLFVIFLSVFCLFGYDSLK